MGRQTIRPYIVALYSLKDEFISILRAKGVEGIGDIYEPKMTLKNDGTQELKFSIPMYIRKETGELVENPLWWNHNRNLIVGMRKIKVIFGEPKLIENTNLRSVIANQIHYQLYLDNIGMRTLTQYPAGTWLYDRFEKDEGKEYRHGEKAGEFYSYEAEVDKFAIYEFLITKVTENHSEGMLTCDVEAEGLAFHELGKTGYKLELTQDTYDSEYSAYYDGIISMLSPFEETEGMKIDKTKLDLSSFVLDFKDKNGSIKSEVTIKLKLDDFVRSDKTYDFNFSSDKTSNIKWQIQGQSGDVTEGVNKLLTRVIDVETGGWDGKPTTIPITQKTVITFSEEEEDISHVELHFINKAYPNAPEPVTISAINLKQNEEVKANINYWVDQVLENSDWKYEVENDWRTLDGVENSSYFGTSDLTKSAINSERERLGFRRMDKVYEDEFVSSWNPDGTPKTYEKTKEKERIVDCKESNRYNILVDIAEKFEVAVKFVYSYDRYFRIVGRKVVFYNAILNDRDIVDITYPYDTDDVTRELDSTDIITKLYVNPIEDDTNLISGEINIADSPANKSGEDYILNFDYLYYNAKTISKEQYDEVDKFEKAIQKINEKLSDILINRSIGETNLNNQKAIRESSVNVINNAIEQINDIKVRIDSLPKGEENIPYDASIQASEEGSFIEINKSGADVKKYPEGVKELKKINKASTTLIYLEIDDKSLTRINIVYDYNPKLYYYDLQTQYETVIKNSKAKQAKAIEEIAKINSLLTDIERDYRNYYKQKERLITLFEKVMGPALREGNWKDDNYKDIGNKGEFIINNSEAEEVTDDKIIVSYELDKVPFDGEQLPYFEVGVSKEKVYYQYLTFSRMNELTNIENLCFVYNNYWKKTTTSTTEDWSPKKTYNKGNIVKITLGNDGVNNFDEYYESVKDNNFNKSPIKFGDNNYYVINSKLIPVVHYSDNQDKGAEVVLLIKDEKRYDVNKKTWEEIDYKDGYFYNISDENLSGASSGLTNVIIPGNNELFLKTFSESDTILYPRILIKDMLTKTGYIGDEGDGTKICLDADDAKTLVNYEDYYITPRFRDVIITVDEKGNEHKYPEKDAVEEDAYCFTIKPETLMKYAKVTEIGSLTYKVYYTISNASTFLYLDARKVAAENAYPQVTYTVKVNAINNRIIAQLYKMLNRICHINDSELKFRNVKGYISEVDMNLDNPWEDEITINNYKTKFEDLFSSIVASSEKMKTNSVAFERAATGFLSTGYINPNVLGNVLNNNELKLNFNDNKLTITQEGGITGVSNQGVVRFRNDGIFISGEGGTSSDNLQLISCITPEGVNGALVKGVINTDTASMMSLSDPSFQMSGSGLYSYKTEEDGSFTGANYVVHNQDGIFLSNDYVDRVEISWNGLTIRNDDNDSVFYADEKGNLTLKGIVKANAGSIGEWSILNDGLVSKDLKVGMTPDSSDGKVFWVNNENPFAVYRDGTVKASTLTLNGPIVASDAILGGVSVTSALLKSGMTEGMFYSKLLGDTFRDSETILMYNVTGSDVNKDNTILQELNSNYWTPVEIIGENEKIKYDENAASYNSDNCVYEYRNMLFKFKGGTNERLFTNVDASNYNIIEQDDGSLTFSIKQEIMDGYKKKLLRFSNSKHSTNIFQIVDGTTTYARVVVINTSNDSITLRALVFSGGKEVDITGSKYNYSWYKENASEPFVTGKKTIVLNNLDSISTYLCKVTSK